MLVAAHVAAALILLAGCKPREQASTQPAASETSKPSLWHEQNQATVVAVGGESHDAKLASRLTAATAEARKTLNDARQRWQFGGSDDQKHWWVKWAAPIVTDASVTGDPDPREQVWVQPVNWTAFRIEGVLCSKPVSDLACGKMLGELVSFPVDELSDWLHEVTVSGGGESPDGKPQGPGKTAHEGGYTMAVLEERFGTPRGVGAPTTAQAAPK